MKWKCKRCDVVFDDSNKKCDCTESPSPWEPYYPYDKHVDLLMSMCVSYKMGTLEDNVFISNLELMVHSIKEI